MISKASISLDLDNLWTYQRTHGDKDWVKMDSYLSLVTPRIIRIFQSFKLKPTIFVIGKDLERDDGLESAKAFHAAGFELANHSFCHDVSFHKLDSTSLVAELSKTEKLIQAISGTKPVGFRGPSFQMTDLLIEALIDRGYLYDSSSYPTSIGPIARAYHLNRSSLSSRDKQQQKHLFGSFSNVLQPLNPYKIQKTHGEIFEVPVTTLPLLRLPIHFTYINYMADSSPVLAKRYVGFALWLCKITNTTPTLLLHPTDFLSIDDASALHFLPGMKRTWRQKGTLLKELLSECCEKFSVLGIRDFLRNDN